MSKKDKIRTHLKRYGSITPLAALAKYGCYRLGARIFELRETMQIRTDIIEKNGSRFAKYVLVKG